MISDFDGDNFQIAVACVMILITTFWEMSASIIRIQAHRFRNCLVVLSNYTLVCVL
jgi:hypothetical protein